MKYLFLFVIALALVGCATFDAARLEQKKGEQGTCFVETENKESVIAKDDSELLVTLALKIPKDDPFLLRTRTPRSSAREYPVVFNIDGQGAEWWAECRADKQPASINGARNPERGEGFKCTLIKRVRLRPGPHAIYVGLLEEQFEKEIRVDLTPGWCNQLHLKPVYRRHRTLGPIFTRGIVDFDVWLNDRRLPAKR